MLKKFPKEIPGAESDFKFFQKQMEKYPDIVTHIPEHVLDTYVKSIMRRKVKFPKGK
jgi:hypothetical protein